MDARGAKDPWQAGPGPVSKEGTATADRVRRRAAQPGRPHGGLSRRRLLLGAAAAAAGAGLAAVGWELSQEGYRAPKTLWRFAAPGGVFSAPVVQSHAVYFGTRSGDVYALGASDGSLLWQHRHNGQPAQSAVQSVAGGTVYVLRNLLPELVVETAHDTLVALRIGDGSTIWEYTPAPDASDPGGVAGGIGGVAVAGGIVCVSGSTVPASLYGLRVGDGRTAWSGPGGSTFINFLVEGPVTANGILYYIAESNDVRALRASDGGTIWSVRIGGDPLYGEVAAAGSTVYVSDGFHRIYALRGSDGGTLWSNRVGLARGLAVAGDMVYAPAFDGHGTYLYALRARDGGAAWRAPLPDYLSRADTVAAADGVVYVGAGAGSAGLGAFRARDGGLLWAQSALTYGVAAAGRLAYAGGRDLYALRA